MFVYTRKSTYEIWEREDGSAEICHRGGGRVSLLEMKDWVFIPIGVIAKISDVKVGERIIFKNNDGKVVRTSLVVEIVQG